MKTHLVMFCSLLIITEGLSESKKPRRSVSFQGKAGDLVRLLRWSIYFEDKSHISKNLRKMLKIRVKTIQLHITKRMKITLSYCHFFRFEKYSQEYGERDGQN